MQVTTSNGIVPGGLYLKVPSDRPPGYIHYKPNEPVGKLNCNLLEIVPKFELCERPKKQMPKTANQPFEVSFSALRKSSREKKVQNHRVNFEYFCLTFRSFLRRYNFLTSFHSSNAIYFVRRRSVTVVIEKV